MRAARRASTGEMRGPLTREKLQAFMRDLARAAPRGRSYRVYLVGGGTAVWAGWRASTVDVDLHGEPEQLFIDIQRIKERLGLNVEFVRPEDFVPALAGSESRHVFIEKIGTVSFYHHDPYAQAFSKIVRGFDRDLEDAESFIASGMVDPEHLEEIVRGIPASAWAKYPALTRDSVAAAVRAFVERPR
jgi:hypothetical protein